MPRRDGEITKARLLEVAERLFAEKGFNGTSISTIAREAGVNKASIYYHFKNKDDIIGSLFVRILEELSEHLDRSRVELPSQGRTRDVLGEIRAEIEYLQTITYILVIASLVQMVEIILKKLSPALYQALGVFLPLITTNCAILGVAILVIQKELNLVQSVVFAVSNALGFGLALIIFAGIREHLDLMDIPEGMKGVPISLIVAGLLSLAFMGFAGIG